jgi:quercetin dioxygenase-like cupin family protein
MPALRLSSLLLLLLGAGTAQEEPVPVDQEPHHRVVLKNDFVEVMHVTLSPGERTLYHTHSHDGAAVELSTGSITRQKVGAAEDPPVSIKPGDLSMTTVSGAGYSHRVRNAGPSTFEVLDVEFLRRPGQPSEVTAGAVAAENLSARGYRWTLDSGGKTPEHTHHRPYLIVAATAMQLKMLSPDGESHKEDVNAGDFHWVDAEVTHVLLNEGPTAGEIVELELK